MSLFGALRTSVSGMNAQSHRIGAVSENIANVSTTGYKRQRAEFETICGSNAIAPYYTGGVATDLQFLNDEQGTIQLTGRATDLAMRGAGFFVVSNAQGTPGLTRAGAFTPDASGFLRNAAGYYLMGYELGAGATTVSNGFSGLSRIDVNQIALNAQASSSGFMIANLDADAPTGSVSNTSLVAYDALGHRAQLDFAYAKTGLDAWSVTISGGAAPVTAALAFDPSTGKIVSPTSLAIPVANGGTVALDIAKMTQYASPFAVSQAGVDGHAPAQLDRVEIGKDGVVAAIYQDGTVVPRYKLPIANVVSPDNLAAVDGNVWRESLASGPIVLGEAQTGGRGAVVSGALEASTVDLGNELTTMIEAQRGYTANSKVFQAGSELLDVLMNLKA
jgi:flagellar hook protein FlgE